MVLLGALRCAAIGPQKKGDTMKLWQQLFNWHIIHDSEMRKIRETELALKRRFTEAQIADLRNGKLHLHKNPTKKVAPC